MADKKDPKLIRKYDTYDVYSDPDNDPDSWFGNTYSIDFSPYFDLTPFEGTNYYDTVKDLVSRRYSKSLGLFGDLFFTHGANTSLQKYASQLYNDISTKYNDYLGKLGDIKENSPVSESAKMVQAGQNPDLLGTEGVSDAPGMMPDPVQAQDDGPIAEGSFGASLERAFSFAFKMFSDGLGIAGAIKDLNLKDYQEFNSGQSSAIDFLTNHADMFDDNGKLDFQTIKHTLKNYGFSSSQLRRFQRHIDSFGRQDIAIMGKIAKGQLDFTKNRKEMFEQQRGLYSPYTSIMEGINEALKPYYKRIQEITPQLDAKKLENEYNYEATLQNQNEPAHRAASENESALSKGQEAKLMRLRKQMETSIYDYLTECSENKDGSYTQFESDFATFMLYSLTISSMLNVSYSASDASGLIKNTLGFSF